MRISTNMMYSAGVARLSELQAGIVKTQQQISTGRRILSPSDDPIGAARALDVSQNQAMNTQYATNRQNVNSGLSAEEGVLQGTTSLLQDVKALSISAGDGALSDSDRLTIATNMQGRLDELLGQANATDGTGNYLFGGFNVASPPFTAAAGGAVYNGDQGQRVVQVATSRQIALGDTGDAVFQNIPSSGVYSARATLASGSTAVASAVTVSDAAALVASDYAIDFKVVAGSATYSVTNKSTSTSVVPAGTPYTAGQPITFDGRRVTINGTPADNDSFAVGESKNRSVFQTLTDLITALKTPVSTATDKANLTHALSVGNANLDHALDNVLTVRSSIGSRQNELDALDSSGSNRDLLLTQTLSQIQDVDYTAAISSFTQQNTTLQAAQKSFVQISGLSLFSLL